MSNISQQSQNQQLKNISRYYRSGESLINQTYHGKAAAYNQNSKPIDKRRAPKLFLLCFSAFCIIGGTYSFAIQHTTKYLFKSTVTPDQKLKSFRQDENNNDNVSDTLQYEGDNNEGLKVPSSTTNLYDSLQFNLNEIAKPNIDMKGNPIRLPPQLANLADIHTPITRASHSTRRNNQNEVPIFWHVPRSGGSSIKDIASFCFGLTLASEVGPIIDPNNAVSVTHTLTTVTDANSGANFVNVDTTSVEGLNVAQNMNLASYEGLDLIVTPYIFLGSQMLFNEVNRGRLFMLLRHPIDRAVSMYYYLRDKTGIRGAQIGDTLDLYAKSSMVENNWMTRFLTNKMGGELTADDEALAKEILKTKCLVGLLSKKTESMRRFKLYYGWKAQDHDGSNEDCEDKLFHWGWSGINKHEMIQEGSDTWNALKEQNAFDVRLYEYAVKIFEVQGATMFQDN